jgi:hypothetical protein
MVDEVFDGTGAALAVPGVGAGRRAEGSLILLS